MRYRILFKDKRPEEKLLREIRARHNQDIEDIDELYEQLIAHGSCDSKTAARIYYVAYTLALENIELILVRVN